MNWYKISQQQFAPIAIVSYFGDELGISFNGGKKYVYDNINQDNHDDLEFLLKKHNYRAAEEKIRSWRPKQEETEEDRQEMLNELYERGILQ